MTLKHPTYAHGISDAELIAEALEFCNEELDGFDGMDYDSDSEVCCQRSNTFIRELVRRLTPSPTTTCDRCQGNGEIVTDWERYKHPHEGDVGDEAVAECPDCNGTGFVDDDTPSPTTNCGGET